MPSPFASDLTSRTGSGAAALLASFSTRFMTHTTQSHAFLLSTLTLLAPAAVISGCHPDVQVQDSGSATDDNSIFDTEADDSSSPDGDDTPTTSAGDPIDPVDYCQLHPDESFPGMAFACSGEFSLQLAFDYYGDPDVPVHKVVPCFDLSDLYDKDEGYVYTCFSSISEEAFGPTAEKAGGKHVEACCLRDAPNEAVDPYCRIDAAQDLCVATSDGLNELRDQIPHLLMFKEINQQLLNLNEFLATGDTQSECALNFAKKLIAGGDIKWTGDAVNWLPQSKMALDADEGWPWFREISIGINKFTLDEVAPTGVSCGDVDPVGVVGGGIGGGTVEFSGSVGIASVDVSDGKFSYRPVPCWLEACPFELQALDLRIEDFDLGLFKFRDVEAALSAPVTGTSRGEAVTLEGQHAKFTATFRVAMGGTPLFDDAALTVDLRAHGLTVAQLTGDGLFSIERLELASWPVEMKLHTRPSKSAPITAAPR